MSDTALAEETFFNQDYLSSALVTGLVLLPLMMLNGLDYYYLLKQMSGVASILDVKTHYNMNDWTRYGWGNMIGGNATFNGMLWTVWLFSFIPHRFFQHSMFWITVISVILNLLNLIVFNIFFVVGYFMDGGAARDLYFVVIQDAQFLTYHAIFYYMLLPRLSAYYRWPEQDWWKWGDYMSLGGAEFDEGLDF